MMSPCSGCVHEKICRHRYIMEEVTSEINKALDNVEVCVEGETYRLENIPWLNLNTTPIRCKNYQEDIRYKMAMQMVQANRNAIVEPNYQICAKPYTI